MARLWSCGFELQTVTSGVEFDTSSGSPTIDTTTFRSGAAALRCNAAGTAKYVDHNFQVDVRGVTFHRFYIRFPSAPSAAAQIYRFGNNAGIYGGSIRISTARKLSLFDIGTGLDVATGNTVLNVDQWYRVEFKFDDTTSTNNGTLLLDGITEISQTDFTTDVGGGGRANLGVRNGVTFDSYFDDWAINNSSGSYQNAYPGAGSIVHIMPNAAGDNTQWQDMASATQGTSVVTNINEVTPDDATTYNKRTTNSPTTTPIDDWNCASSASVGIGPSDTINVVAVGVRFGATSSTATNRGGIVRLKSASGGTTTSSGTLDWSQSGWDTHVDGTYVDGTPKVHQIISHTDPTTGVPWTPTGTNSLDNMQIGYKAAQSSANEIRVTTLWALVEYVLSNVAFIPRPNTSIQQAVNRASTY